MDSDEMIRTRIYSSPFTSSLAVITPSLTQEVKETTAICYTKQIHFYFVYLSALACGNKRLVTNVDLQGWRAINLMPMITQHTLFEPPQLAWSEDTSSFVLVCIQLNRSSHSLQYNSSVGLFSYMRYSSRCKQCTFVTFFEHQWFDLLCLSRSP